MAKSLFEGRTKRFAYVNNVPCLEEIEFAESGGEKEEAVCYAGTLSEGRGVTNLVRAADLAGVTLYLAGSFITEEYQEELQSMKEWRSVRFLGYVGRKEVYHMYSKSKIGMCTLLPVGQYAKSSNLPTKAYEYMSCEIPVILSDFPYNRKMVEKYQFGEVVNPCDAGKIAEKIRELVADESRCRQMGERGKSLVKNKLNFDVEGKNLTKLYDEILKDK